MDARIFICDAGNKVLSRCELVDGEVPRWVCLHNEAQAAMRSAMSALPRTAPAAAPEETRFEATERGDWP